MRRALLLASMALAAGCGGGEGDRPLDGRIFRDPLYTDMADEWGSCKSTWADCPTNWCCENRRCELWQWGAGAPSAEYSFWRGCPIGKDATGTMIVECKCGHQDVGGDAYTEPVTKIFNASCKSMLAAAQIACWNKLPAKLVNAIF